MINKNEPPEKSKYGFELIEVNECYLLVNNQRIISIAEEEWFKKFLEKLSKVILNYYSDFQIYLAYLNIREGRETILGYVYVKSAENKSGDKISDVNLNKAMTELTDQCQEIELVFITIQTKERRFKKLKKGDLNAHFHFSRHLF